MYINIIIIYYCLVEYNYIHEKDVDDF